MKRLIYTKHSFQNLLSFILTASVLTGTFSVAAQTRRGSEKRTAPSKSSKTPPVSSNPNAGWSGVITFTKTREDIFSSDEPAFGTLDKQNERVKHFNNENFIYTGKLLVNDGQATGQPLTTAKVEYTDSVSHKGAVTQWTRCHSHENDRLVRQDDSDLKITTGEGQGEAKSYDLSVYYEQNKYRFSFTLPDADGTYSREENVTYSNLCVAKEPYRRTDNSATKMPGAGAQIEATLDPENPDVLKGSKTWTDGSAEIKGFTYTVAWNLKRKPMPLMITNVKFYQPLFPSPNSWNEIKENGHTIDGNQVKIVATIANLSGETKSANVQFKELKENVVLPEGAKSETFQPHEEKEIELLWDTNGYAWKEANVWNQPEIHRLIQVRIPDDVMSKDIEVDPKPVVVIPGLWSNAEAVGKFMGFFKSLPTTEWAIDLACVYVGKTAAENAPVVEKTVKDLQKKENAWHVDLVGHSTGGLIGRSYVNSLMPTQFDGKPTAAHLVMIGTPNMGTPCAGGVENIITRIFNRNADSLREVMIKNMRVFNQTITETNGTKFSVLVGNAYAPVCQLDAPGDGITPNRSAIWTIKTWKFSTARTRHEEMPGDQSNFLQIINWLAVSPKGEKPDGNTNGSIENFSNDFYAGMREENFGKFRNYGALYHPISDENLNANNNDDAEPNFSTGVKLAPMNTTEIEIPVTSGSKLSIVFLAPPNVSATLIDDKGEITGQNTAGTPESVAAFRTITVKNPFQKGSWKLKLESREQTESEIAVAAFVDYTSTIFSEKPNR